MKKSISFILLLMLFTTLANAQSVGIGSASFIPNSRSLLEIKGPDNTTSYGFLVPRMDWQYKPAASGSADQGLMIYVTGNSASQPGYYGIGYYYYNGSAWQKLFDLSSGNPWKLNGNANTSVPTDFIGTTDNVGLVFKTNDTERMRLLSTGELAIGYSSAGGVLNVHQENIKDVVQLYSYDYPNIIRFRRSAGTPSAPTAALNSGLCAGKFVAQAYDGSSYGDMAAIEMNMDAPGGPGDMPGSISFYTSADGTASLNEKMRITNNGNVGIGTQYPTAKLHVGGSIKIADVLSENPSEIRSISNASSLWFLSNNGSFSKIAIGPTLDWDQQASIMYTPYTVGAASGELSIGQLNKNSATWTHGLTRFYTNGGERMRINASGNVGVGTTTPATKLDIAGTTKANAFVQNNNGLRLVAPDGASYVTSTSSVTGAIKITLPQYRSSTMMRMTIKIYQYTTDQSYTIELGGYNYGSGSWYNTFANITSTSGANLNVRFGYDGTPKNCIWIGETSSVWSYPQIFVTDFQAGYSNYSADQWDDGWSISIVGAYNTVENTANPAFNSSGTGTANYITKWTSPGTQGNSIAYDNGTNIGIGTTSPTQKLTVAGNINKSGSWVVSDVAWGANNLEVHNSSWDGSSNGNYGGIVGGHGYYYGGLQSGGGSGSEAGNGQLYVASTSMLMGNVGIGTTSPAAGLHLYQDRYTLYGPNSSWGAYLQVGGNGRVTTYASVAATNGNLHLDAANGGYATYINYYSQNNTYINAQAGNVGIGTASPSQKLEVNGNMQLSSNGNGIWMRDETTGTNWHVHDHGDRIRTYNGSTELVYVTTADLGGNCILNQYGGAQSANMWISGETRTGNWFRNSTAGCGLYNESTGSGIYSPSANLMTLYNASSLQITSASTGSGNLRFDAANPYIVSSSYYVCPGGAYFNGGTVYTEAQYQCRGGIHNDTGGDLTIAGGTNGTTYFSGPISGMSGNYPSNNMIRLTPNLHLNSNAGYATIINWDNGTTGTSQTFRIGNGSGSDVFDVLANGYCGIGYSSPTYPLSIYMPSSSLYGVYSYDANYISGSGYNANSARAMVSGLDWDSQTYEFGVAGFAYNDYTRCGGVLGSQWNASYWGSLGYKNSGSSVYGCYYTSVGSGGGFMDNAGIMTGIGSGGYGGVMGGWSRGEVLGFTSAGELYASYNLGNEYTSGVSADIVSTATERIPVYSVTSNQVKVYADGYANLINGTCRVNFDKAFESVISSDGKPTVTVTPIGECRGIYISEIDNNGFTVKEQNGGTSSVEFSWIAIGKRIDADKVSNLPEALQDKNFDNHMKGVMFNENNKEQNATPIWWDGTKLRFDTPPPLPSMEKKEEPPVPPLKNNSGDDVNKLIQNSKTTGLQNNVWKPTPGHPIQDEGNKFEKSSYPAILKEN